MGKQMRRCVIVGSAPFSDTEYVLSYLRDDDYVIAADGGQKFLTALGKTYDLLVGDFDSSRAPVTADDRTISLPTHKDDTDVLAAIRIALKKGYRDYLLLGCLGGRFDHTLANVFLLRFLHQHGASGCLVDQDHEISLLSAGVYYVPARDDRVLSLLPYGGDAVGVSIDGAEYPLRDATLDTAMPLGVSNAFIGKTVTISLKKGFLLMILAKNV